MVEPEAGIMRLARETRQMIYDYIVSDTPDRTIRVTLVKSTLNSKDKLQKDKPQKEEPPKDKLHVENWGTILNLICTHWTFENEVLSYLYQSFTFVLTDSERTCRPIVGAFYRALAPKNRVRVRRIAIPFFTIRNLFDPAYFDDSSVLQRSQEHRLNIIDNAHLHPYVLRILVLSDDTRLQKEQAKLLEELVYALLLLNQMPGLECLTLGVDVLEFLTESILRPEGIYRGEPSVPTSDLTVLIDQVRQGKLHRWHRLIDVLGGIRGLGKLRYVRLELDWSNFVQDKYQRAGVTFGPPWTKDVKEEMELRFSKMVTASITSMVARTEYKRQEVLDFPGINVVSGNV
ncbi:uncharacterized protein J4E84_001325 [Alternaria hordeiaustralica]|uniref:uncharacterized protein n=1 Tax=Alternaria hordeiaustralica TaxID=1187925 RepID=UPI0020C3B4C4|nr:uncharacterized protein J4E84_001325 [Alternaria hordeiaustralica]KAI4698190.1 hypothetical protein J4E84_001325 [Alternaria hordeiaustralica]